MNRAAKGLLLLLAVVVLSGCGGGGGGSASMPSPSPFAGSWQGVWSFAPDSQGTINGATSQSGTITLDIGENGVVTGTIRNLATEGGSEPPVPPSSVSSIQAVTYGQTEGWIKPDGEVKLIFSGCRTIFPNSTNPASSYVCMTGPLYISADHLKGSAYFAGYDLTSGIQITTGTTGTISFTLDP